VILYIDIKSERLYNILRVVLHDIKAISLIEDKLSVIRTKRNLKKNANVDLDRVKRPFLFPPGAR
jgi:hypothetical protein